MGGEHCITEGRVVCRRMIDDGDMYDNNLDESNSSTEDDGKR